MSLSSFTVCMNALRLNLFKVHETGRDRKLSKRALTEDELEKIESASNACGIGGSSCKACSETENKTNNNDKGDNKMTVKIEGMMCPHCEATVKKAMEALDGVEEAVVSHESGTAVLTTSKDVPEEVIKKAVEDKDYKFIGIE